MSCDIGSTNIYSFRLTERIPTLPSQFIVLDETELGVQIPKSNVPGRIREERFRKFWFDMLHPPRDVKRALEVGYELPFTAIPPESELPNNGSALKAEHRPVVDATLRELEACFAIRRAVKKPHLILPLQIAINSAGEPRLVVDASRSLNKFLHCEQVKLDHLQKILPEIPAGSWFATMDLLKGYYHVKVAEHHRKYLGVKWRLASGEEVTYEWNVTFLGISDLVHFFTKLLVPLKVLCLR